MNQCEKCIRLSLLKPTTVPITRLAETFGKCSVDLGDKCPLNTIEDRRIYNEPKN